MRDWKYDELLNAVKETYDDFIKEDRNDRLAVAKTFYEFETVCNEGKTENLLVHVALGEIIRTHEKVFVGNYEAIKKELETVDVNQFQNELTSEEMKDLLNRIKKVLDDIENVQIDDDPNAD